MRSRARQVARELKQVYGEVRCGLHHVSAFQLLIAAMLSAEGNSDARVNRVTRLFFHRYLDARTVAAAESAELKLSLRSARCPLQSARTIRGACEVLVADYEGEVPDTMSALRSLGIGRETASVVLRTWFGKTERVMTDAHGFRVALRLGLAPPYESPDGKERRLTELVPGVDRADFGYCLAQHGRKVCHAQSPKCGKCALRDACPRVGLDDQAGMERKHSTHHGPSKSPRWAQYKIWWPYRI